MDVVRGVGTHVVIPGVVASAMGVSTPPPPSDSITFVGSVVRWRSLDQPAPAEFELTLPEGTQIGDTAVLWIQGYLYDPPREGWDPAFLETGAETWAFRTRRITSLSSIILPVSDSRAVVSLMVFRGAGPGAVLRRTRPFQSISNLSGTMPGGNSLSAGKKFILEAASLAAGASNTRINEPYPYPQVIVKYDPTTIGSGTTQSIGTIVGWSTNEAVFPPAVTWNVSAVMTANRYCLFGG